jgi:hypothetical protein
MANLSALITKDASLDAPNVRGYPKLSLSLGIVYTQTKNFGLSGLSGHLKFIFCVFLCRLSRGRKEAYLSSVLSVLFFLFVFFSNPSFLGL